MYSCHNPLHNVLPMLKKSLILGLLTSLFLVACQPDLPAPEPMDAQEPAVTTDEQKPDNPEDAPKEEWSSYASTSYGFSFEYPKSWTLEEDTHARPYVLLTSPERREAGEGAEGDQMILIDAKIRVYPSNEDLPNNDEGLSFEQWIDTEDTYLNGEVTPTTVAGAEGFTIEGIDSFNDSPTLFTMVEHNGKIYELNFNVAGANDYTAERAHMLSSFKFLASEEAPTASTNTGTSVACEDETCMYTKFETCEAATFSADAGFAAITYEIFGPKDGGCEMSLVYTKNPNPEWEDKTLLCTFDNTLDFQTAVGEQLTAASNSEGSTCSGSLLEVLSNL